MQDNTVMVKRSVIVARWVARCWAATLFLVWGAFFLEHLAWFANPQHLPPPRVFLLVGLHFLMLLGLLAGWRWEFAGAVLTLTTAVPFFAATAGRNFPWFTLLTVVPSALWFYCAWQECREQSPNQADDRQANLQDVAAGQPRE